jgi:hypothetical protein
MSQKEADQLDDYLDDPEHNSAPDAATRQVVEGLRQQVEQLEPRPQFVNQLSAQLQANAAERSTPRSFAGWLTMRFVPRLVGTAVAIGVIVFLVWWLPQLWQQWQNPEVEPVLGDVVPVSERITNNPPEMFPEVPAEMPLYEIKFEPEPATPEEAVEWAADFGIPDPQAFTDPRQPGMIQVIGSNEETLLFHPFNPGSIVYSTRQDWWFSNRETASGEPLPFAQAAEIAVNFLAERDLLPADYQLIDEAVLGEGQGRLRTIVISPKLADEYAGFTGSAGPGAIVGVTADGQVKFAHIILAQATPGEMVAIMSAREAYEAYRAGELRAIGMETRGMETAASSIQTFFPPPPEHQVGDEVEVVGWPSVLVAADGSEIRATLQTSVPGVYHLAGEQVQELAEADVSSGELVVRGMVTAVRNPGEWELTITDWEMRPVLNSYNPFTCLKGTFSREAESTDWLTADDNTRYRLPDAPAELNEGDRIEVCSDTAPEAALEAGAEIAWTNISRPPASEAAMSEAGMSVSAVEVPVTAVPTAAPAEAMTEVVLEEGQAAGNLITVERSVVVTVDEASQPEAPYELGESVSLTGTVNAYIYEENDGSQRYVVHLQLLDKHGLITTTLPLTGTADVLEEIANEHYGRFLQVTGEIVPHPHWAGQAVAVESFTAVWPDAGLQNFLGHMEQEMVDGATVTVFVDRETEQRYLVAWDGGYHGGTAEQPQLLLTGIIHPAKEVSGLPVLIMHSSKGDNYIAQATDASEFPLEDKPPIIFPPPPGYDSMMIAEMVLEYMELSYYFEPAYDYSAPSSPGSPPPLAEVQIARPVWHIYGRSPDGLTKYKIYVEAMEK